MLPLIIAGAGLAINALGALSSHKSQNDAAAESARAAAEQKRNVTNAANASAAASNNMLNMRLDENQVGFDQTIQALAAQRSEQRIAANQSILATDRAARMADGQSRLSAGAAGVAGASVDAVLSNVGVQAAGARQSINNNLGSVNRQLDRQETATRDTFFFTQRATEAERQGIEADRLNRIAGVSTLQGSPQANPFATALQIGGALVDFGSQYAKNH